MCLSEAKASHSQRMWPEVSCFTPHLLHSGLSSSPEKSVSNCTDRQAALKELQTAKTTSPLAQLCQKALSDVSTQHTVGLYWVPGHRGVQGNKIVDKLARGGSVQKFVGSPPSLRVR
jgi:hypothetical protein